MNIKKRFGTINDQLRMPHTDQTLCQTMSDVIISWLPNIPRDYVIVCIGTDRSTGDALGPLTGTYFQEMKPRHMTVYGTLHDPIHATNLKDKIDMIYKNHRDPFIIAIDACLGKNSSVGQLIASKGALKPGAALNKALPEIGDLHITAVVNISGFMEYSVLQNTRLSFVVDMAKQIANVLNQIDHSLKYNYSVAAIVNRDKRKRSV